MDEDDPEKRIAELERQLAFSKSASGKRGYSADEVDEFLDRVAIELARRAGQ
jgi:DivIVA domain-containing protein